MFHLNCRGISRQKKIVFLGTISSKYNCRTEDCRHYNDSLQRALQREVSLWFWVTFRFCTKTTTNNWNLKNEKKMWKVQNYLAWYLMILLSNYVIESNWSKVNRERKVPEIYSLCILKVQPTSFSFLNWRLDNWEWGKTNSRES